MRCFDCGEDGHIAPNCPNSEMDSGGRPPWCGVCDERTRHIDAGDVVARCQVCHPLRNRQLRQHRKCPHCRMTVYQWDNEKCGNHASPVAPDRRLERERVEAIIASERLDGAA